MDSFDPNQRYLDAQEALSRASRGVALIADAADAAAKKLVGWGDPSAHGLHALAELAATAPTDSWHAQGLADALVGLREAQQDVERAWELVLRQDAAR